jgi:hypothetical protein
MDRVANGIFYEAAEPRVRSLTWKGLRQHTGVPSLLPIYNWIH